MCRVPGSLFFLSFSPPALPSPLKCPIVHKGSPTYTPDYYLPTLIEILDSSMVKSMAVEPKVRSSIPHWASVREAGLDDPQAPSSSAVQRLVFIIRFYIINHHASYLQCSFCISNDRTHISLGIFTTTLLGSLVFLSTTPSYIFNPSTHTPIQAVFIAHWCKHWVTGSQ